MTFAQALTAWGLSATLGVGRELDYAQGKVVGGGSAINGALALRGMPADYDRWAPTGAGGWDWTGLLPSFRRLETDLDFKNDLHGSDGPMPIRRWAQRDLIPIQSAFLAAARECGFGWADDHNDPGVHRYRTVPDEPRRRHPPLHRADLPGAGPRRGRT